MVALERCQPLLFSANETAFLDRDVIRTAAIGTLRACWTATRRLLLQVMDALIKIRQGVADIVVAGTTDEGVVGAVEHARHWVVVGTATEPVGLVGDHRLRLRHAAINSAHLAHVRGIRIGLTFGDMRQAAVLAVTAKRGGAVFVALGGIADSGTVAAGPRVGAQSSAFVAICIGLVTNSSAGFSRGVRASTIGRCAIGRGVGTYTGSRSVQGTGHSPPTSIAAALGCKEGVSVTARIAVQSQQRFLNRVVGSRRQVVSWASIDAVDEVGPAAERSRDRIDLADIYRIRIKRARGDLADLAIADRYFIFARSARRSAQCHGVFMLNDRAAADSDRACRQRG